MSFDYGALRIDGPRPGPAVYDAAAGRVLLRDLDAERAAMARLRALGVREERPWSLSDKGTHLLLAPAKLDALVAALTAEGWRVEAEGVTYRAAGRLATRVRSGVDWFDLEGAADFGGVAVSFPRLLDAVRRGARTVVLDDGTHGLLPSEWLARLAPLAALGIALGTNGNGSAGDAPVAARFSRAQAPLLDALLDQLPAVDVDAAFAQARDALRAYTGVAPADPPAGFVGTLRGYQREGLGWLGWLRTLGVGGCLADDMGLGKTVQVLAHLETRREAGAGPALAVVPRSLLYNWQAEAARFAPAMRVLDYTGANRPRDALRAALDAGAADLVLTTYGTLRRDAPTLAEVEFDTVVLDEAQAIKNAGTAASKAARLLRARHRLAMTGTPVENRMEELWALFDFLSPGLLGAARGRAAAALDVADAPTEEGTAARSLLARALRPYILRRTKAEVATDLPPRQEQTIWVTLGEAERALYDELRDHYRAELLGARGARRDGEVAHPRARGAAPAAAGGVSPGARRPGAQGGARGQAGGAARAGARGRRGRAQGARLLAVHQAARAGAHAAGGGGGGVRVPRRADAGPRRGGDAVPGGSGVSGVPGVAQGGRGGIEPDGGGVRVSAGPVVESRDGGAGDRPGASDRADAGGVRGAAGGAGYGGGAGAGAAGDEAGVGGGGVWGGGERGGGDREGGAGVVAGVRDGRCAGS